MGMSTWSPLRTAQKVDYQLFLLKPLKFIVGHLQAQLS